MVKRSTHDTDGAAAFRKRQKLTQDIPTGEQVTSSEQLRQLLTFDQDMRKARHGVYLSNFWGAGLFLLFY